MLTLVSKALEASLVGCKCNPRILHLLLSIIEREGCIPAQEQMPLSLLLRTEGSSSSSV